MTSLSKSVSLINKFTVSDTGTENKDSVLGEASISLRKRGDSAPFGTTATLPFEGAKLLPDGKKTWLGARSETLEAERGQTSSWMVGKAESLAAIKKGAAV